MKTKSEFQFGNVVGFKDQYLYDGEDEDKAFRAMVLGQDDDDLYWLIVISIGIGGEKFGDALLMPGNMFEIDPKYTK